MNEHTDPDTSPKKLGRPVMNVLNRALIVETALALFDRRGGRGISMRELADELGVRPSALYNHIASKDDLMHGVRELMSDRCDVSGFGVLPWDHALERWARSYLQAFAAHPTIVAVLAVQPLADGSRAARMYNTVCAALIAAGWPQAEVLKIIVALESFILGSALDYAAPDDMFDLGDMAQLPALRRAYAARAQAVAETGGPAVASFEIGLAALLHGFRVRFDRVREQAATAIER